MPLPKTSITLQGGCNCGAIRYKLKIPEYHQRFLHPTTPEGKKDGLDAVRFPFTVTCCCNDCRQATAGILVGGICMLADGVTVSCLSRNSEQARRQDAKPFDGKTFGMDSPARGREANGKLTERQRIEEDGDGHDLKGVTEAERPPYRPGIEMLLPSEASGDTFVGFYHSSANRTRSFCQRCGTPIAYNIWPMPASLPDIIDIIMGSLDREDFERIGEPDAHLWWNWGVNWIKSMMSASKTPKYPNWRVDETI